MNIRQIFVVVGAGFKPAPTSFRPLPCNSESGEGRIQVCTNFRRLHIRHVSAAGAQIGHILEVSQRDQQRHINIRSVVLRHFERVVT